MSSKQTTPRQAYRRSLLPLLSAIGLLLMGASLAVWAQGKDAPKQAAGKKTGTKKTGEKKAEAKKSDPKLSNLTRLPPVTNSAHRPTAAHHSIAHAYRGHKSAVKHRRNDPPQIPLDAPSRDK